MTKEALDTVLQKNPKIIHISSHGAQILTETGLVTYLAIEDHVHYGLEQKYFQKDLK